VILVTHDMQEVRERCDRALLLDGGRLVADGDPEEVADQYLRLNETGGLREGAAQRVDRGPRVAPPAPPAVPIEPRTYAQAVFTLAAAEFKLRYLYAKLSYLWAVGRPLAMFAVIYLFTTRVAKFEQGDHYAVYLLAAIVLWTFVEQATHSSVQALVHHEPLLRKVPINHSIVPLSVVLTALFDLAMNLVAVAVLLAASRVVPRAEWLEVPLLVLVLATLAASLSLALSALYVRFRDLHELWQVITYALFFGTPIFYAIDTLPEGARRWFLLNPIAAVMTQLRHVLVDPGAPSAAAAMGGARYLLGPLAVMVAAFVLGVWVFRRESPRVAENL
jgi:ABC-2 type transport system permease protein